MANTPVKKIAIFGNGLAGLLCAAKLVKILPNQVELTYVEATNVSATDIFFGTVTTPSTYDFLLGLDVSEPDILPATNTNFSLGTQYKDWGPENRAWTQGYHRPLPAFNGVGFHHYLTRLKSAAPELSELELYIMSVAAAKAGVFAHPPEGKNIPLADIEYGYHFIPEEFCALLSSKLRAIQSLKWLTADIRSSERKGDDIQSVSLSNGDILKADFIVDALGPQSKLAAPKSQTQVSERQLKAVSSVVPTNKLGGVCRVLTGAEFGWQSETPSQNGTRRLTVFAPESETEALNAHGNFEQAPVYAALGGLQTPWLGNCLILGHGAAIVEPLTPAPILLLQRDIERLAELIPVTNQMKVESREYNRRFTADYEHAALFQSAFFVSETVAETPYLIAASTAKSDERLSRKIQQFRSRGVLVQYDYEPFDEKDWTMLHFGMGRYPTRYDPLADHIPDDQLKNRLTQMRAAIEMMAKKMPPHHIYMTGLLKYLKEKHG